jgi:hypothetical protein
MSSGSAPDLALAYKLALVLRKAADDHPDWRLPELTGGTGGDREERAALHRFLVTIRALTLNGIADAWW